MSFQPWQRKEEVEPIERRTPDSWNSRNSNVQNNMRNNTGWSLFSQVLAEGGFDYLKQCLDWLQEIQLLHAHWLIWQGLVFMKTEINFFKLIEELEELDQSRCSSTDYWLISMLERKQSNCVRIKVKSEILLSVISLVLFILILIFVVLIIELSRLFLRVKDLNGFFSSLFSYLASTEECSLKKLFTKKWLNNKQTENGLSCTVIWRQKNSGYH